MFDTDGPAASTDKKFCFKMSFGTGTRADALLLEVFPLGDARSFFNFLLLVDLLPPFDADRWTSSSSSSSSL
jgi:hypothetical protein